MRSRALPENFDFAQTLQPGFRDPRSHIDPVASLSNLSLRGGAMPRRPTLRLGLDQRNLPPNNAASVYTNVPSSVGAAIGSANLSPVSSINEGSQYSGSQYSETQSPLAPTQYSHPFGQSNSLSVNPQTQQRQTELFRQRSSSSAQPTPGIRGNTSTYRDYDFSDATRAPSQPQNAPQHAATFPQVQNPTSRISPLAAPNTMLYDERQTIYPQAAAGPRSYQASYSQNVELSGWQTGQMVPENLRYDPSNPQRSAIPQAPTPQSGSDSYVYDQLASYQGPIYDEPTQQPFSPPPTASLTSGSSKQPGTDASRQRGSTFPSYYTYPR